MTNILDKAFRYVPSSKTDIRKTFAKARKLIAEQQAAQASNQQEAQKKVAPMRKVSK